MIQKITFPEIGTFTLGVDEPVVLAAKSSSGARIQYSIVSGDATLDGVQLTPTKTGTIEVKATAPAYDGYDQEELTVSFDVVNGDYYQRAGAITEARKRLDDDIQDLNEIALVGLDDVNTLTLRPGPDGKPSSVIVNGEEYVIEYSRFVKKFINMSMKFWEDEIVKEEARLQQMITELKTIDPQ